MPGQDLFQMLLADVEEGKLTARRRTYAKGEVVFHEGDTGDSVHLVVEGMFGVRITTPPGGTLILDILEPGGVFGEFAVFSTQGRRTSGIGAMSGGETLEIGRSQLRNALHERPELCERLIATIVDKTDRANRRLTELLYVPAEIRVLRALLELTDEEDREVDLTQADLASFAATTRPTANRVLREEAARGTVTMGRGRITVVDAERLARRARISVDRPTTRVS